MLFRVTIAEYDSDTERAYVELRAPDNDGEEIIATTIFSFSIQDQTEQAPNQIGDCPKGASCAKKGSGGNVSE